MKQLLTSYGIDTQPYTSIGSGFVKTTGLKGTNSQNIIPLTIVATNRHVFWGYNGSVKANSCKVFLSGNHTYFISPNYILDPNSSINDLHREVINGQPYVVPKIDAGYFLISNPDSYIQQIADNGNNVCNAQPKIGDSVIILGYPAIGSANSITATDGIISGIESNYYVTSAKVEHGNSGGAAILKDKNCYVGIPSYAETGDIESLARILDFNLIFK
jgi:hypothetical protein